jgi:hypothetical protein
MAKKSSKSMGLGRKQAMSGWQLVTFALVVGAIGGAISWAAFAAPHNSGGGKGGGTISLVMVTDVNGDGSPNYGDTVTFKLNTSLAYPWVETVCSQNGTTVYQQYSGFYASYTGSQNFTLGPTEKWQGGAAECTASLVTYSSTGKQQTVSSTTFHVNV